MGFAQIEPTSLDNDATGVDTLRVLLIDHDLDDQRMVRDLIEDHSEIVCDVATGLEDGYDAVLAGEHDAYLVALRPGSESDLERIRELANEAPGPLVVLTQTVEDDADVYALNVGAEYLVKDRLSPELVERRLRHSVERWRVRRRAEEGFLKYRSLFDGVPVGLFRIRPDGTFVEVNATAVRALGYDDQSQLVGRKIDELLADDQSLEIPILAGAGEGELHLETRDGDNLWVSVTLEEVRDDAGDVTHYEGAALDITEQKEAERELRRYRELTAAAYGESSVAKAIVSLPEGRIISANNAICAFLGYDRESLTGMHFEDVTHPDDLGADVLQFKRLIDSEIDNYDIIKRYVRSDGSVVWGRLQVSMIHGDGGVGYVLGEIVDITETKEAQGNLAFQASLFEQMRTPVLATDRRGLITHWNRQAEIAYGWSAEEVMGRDFIDLALPDLDPSQLDTMRADFRAMGLWEGELTITRKDGSTFPAWASGAVVRDESGQPAGVVGAIVDLSDVQKARADALTHEMLSRSLLEAVSIPIAILDSGGDIVASNPSWALGGDARVHPYVPCPEEEAPAAETVGQIESGVESVVAGEEDRFSLEYVCDVADGERWMRVVAAPAEGGGAIVSHWDITDERFARTALEETIRAKDEFITSVSHELRTPLSVVVGLAETLRSGRYSEAESSEFHDLIADQSQEMALIVEDLLVAGRMDSDTLTVRESMVDLEDEIDAVLRPLVNKDVDVSVRLIPGAEKVYADSLRVRQILRNLITNAVRYGEPPVRIKAVRARDKVIVSVCDHGEGVPENALEKMFHPYSRFGTADGQPSSVGLGLHVARRLARLMGGDLAYKSDAELTTFLLTLRAESPDNERGSGDGMRFVHF